MFIIFINIISLLVSHSVSVSTSTPTLVSTILNGTNDYIQFYIGNTNILLTVPHDGSLQPVAMTTRTNDKLGNLLRDRNTKSIAFAIRDYFVANYGIQPFILVNNLHRSKMDPNRSPDECCWSQNELSYISYNEYHGYIQQFEQYTAFGQQISRTGERKIYNQALLIDIHGQAHPEGWIELGYDLSANTLNNNNNNNLNRASSTICSMASQSSFTFEQILRGSVSLGKFISDQLYPIQVVPSPNVPSPDNGKYYSGGYTSQTYGSLGCKGNTNAIQMELPLAIRNNGNAILLSASQSLAIGIYNFYTTHQLYATLLHTPPLSFVFP